MTTYLSKVRALPENIRQLLCADIGLDILSVLGIEFKFDAGKQRALGRLVIDIFAKEKKVGGLVTTLKNNFKLTEKQAKELALKLTIRRFLVIDDYLEGEASKLIKKLGGDPSTHEEALADYRKRAQMEAAKQKAEEEADAAKHEYVPPTPKPDSGEIESEDLGDLIDVTTTETALADFKRLIKGSLLDILINATPETRLYFNGILIPLLVEKPEYQQELIKELANNQDKISSDFLMHNNQRLEPTVANWLTDFVSHLNMQLGEPVSTVQKAKYYANNENYQKLSAQDKELLDKVFDLYGNLINFQMNANRLEFMEMPIFSLTNEEREQINKKYGEAPASEEVTGPSAAADIYQMYLGDPAEREELRRLTEKINQETRRDANQVVNFFHNYVLQRKKLEIIACLRILVEIGFLDDVVYFDKRFKELIAAYLKRNNLMDDLTEYQTQPAQPKFIKYFLQYLLMERLGMPSSNAARVAMQLGNLYREQGQGELAKLAYFDIPTNQFKWF